MDIKFIRSGDFVGGISKKEIREENMPTNLKDIVKHLIENKNHYHKIKPSEHLRDGFVYALEIIKKSPKLKFTFNEGNLPTELLPLINHFLTSE